jgi:hypothetical protein
MSTPSLLVICSILPQMIPSFRRRRPPRIRTCWSKHHPESHRMGSESSLHPGQRLSTLRIFAVQRSLPGAARPAVRPECPSRVSPAPIAEANQPRECRHLLIADGRHRAYVRRPGHPGHCRRGDRPAPGSRGTRCSDRLRRPPGAGHYVAGSVRVLRDHHMRRPAPGQAAAAVAPCPLPGRPRRV